MAAVVRVKRRRSEDPADSLVVCCKKARETSSEDTNYEEVKQMFKFAGTVPKKDGTVSKKVRDAIRKEKLEREYKRHEVSLTGKSRNNKKHIAQDNRYKVVARKRAIDLDSLDQEENPKCSSENAEGATALNDTHSKATECTESKTDSLTYESESQSDNPLYCLYDVVHEEQDKENRVPSQNPGGPETITCNSVPLIRERVLPQETHYLHPQLRPPPIHEHTDGPDSDYVYDLYYLNHRDFNFQMLENILAIEALREDYEYDEYRSKEYDDCYEDEDDSNDEDNWRNDYPDERPTYEDLDYDYADDLTSGYQQSMAGLMQYQCALGNENQDGEEYEDNEDLENEPDPSSLWAPNCSYEQYKKQIYKEMNDQQ